jgi:hypothetical protein
MGNVLKAQSRFVETFDAGSGLDLVGEKAARRWIPSSRASIALIADRSLI